MNKFEIGQRVIMIDDCKDNQNIKAGEKGTVEFINRDGIVEVEFDHHVTGKGISGNSRNNHLWFVERKNLVKLVSIDSFFNNQDKI